MSRLNEIKPGDYVNHRFYPWEKPERVVRIIGSKPFDPVAIFADGGFWRLSRLVRVDPPTPSPSENPGE